MRLPPHDRAGAGAKDYLSHVRFYHDNGGETSVEKTIIAESGACACEYRDVRSGYSRRFRVQAAGVPQPEQNFAPGLQLRAALRAVLRRLEVGAALGAEPGVGRLRRAALAGRRP